MGTIVRYEKRNVHRKLECSLKSISNALTISMNFKPQLNSFVVYVYAEQHRARGKEGRQNDENAAHFCIAELFGSIHRPIDRPTEALEFERRNAKCDLAYGMKNNCVRHFNVAQYRVNECIRLKWTCQKPLINKRPRENIFLKIATEKEAGNG